MTRKPLSMYRIEACIQVRVSVDVVNEHSTKRASVFCNAGGCGAPVVIRLQKTCGWEQGHVAKIISRSRYLGC
jgi:hypothetical protein